MIFFFHFKYTFTSVLLKELETLTVSLSLKEQWHFPIHSSNQEKEWNCRNHYQEHREARGSAEWTQASAACAHGTQVLDGPMCLYNKKMILDRQEIQTNRLSLVEKGGHCLGWKWRRAVYMKDNSSLWCKYTSNLMVLKLLFGWLVGWFAALLVSWLVGWLGG